MTTLLYRDTWLCVVQLRKPAAPHQCIILARKILHNVPQHVTCNLHNHLNMHVNIHTYMIHVPYSGLRVRGPTVCKMKFNSQKIVLADWIFCIFE